MITGELGLSLIIMAFAMGIANIILLMFLLKTYWKTYKQIKSGFTIGLLYFASFFFLQNIVSTIFIALLLVIPMDANISELHGPRLPYF